MMMVRGHRICSAWIHMIRLACAVAVALILLTTPVFAQSTPIAELRVSQTAADVHRFPSIASPIIGRVVAGTVVEIRRNLGSWVEVPWPGAEAGTAFLHVNAGTIAHRSPVIASNGAQAAVSEISAVAAAVTATVSRTAGQPARNGQAARRPTSYVSLPSHRLAMGASMNPSKPEFGATVRTWWRHRLGAQFHASRPRLQSADGRSLESTQFAPSALYSLPEAVTDSVWLRPYAGAGPRLYRANLETRLGYEAFGGVEVTLAALPQFTLSGDFGSRWSRPSFTGFEPRRTGFLLSGHWYVK
jgi:hypothetical protein